MILWGVFLSISFVAGFVAGVFAFAYIFTRKHP